MHGFACILEIQVYRAILHFKQLYIYMYFPLSIVHMHPRHFVCGVSNNDAAYNEDSITGRLSVTYCTGTLQQSQLTRNR